MVRAGEDHRTNRAIAFGSGERLDGGSGNFRVQYDAAARIAKSQDQRAVVASGFDFSGHWAAWNKGQAADAFRLAESEV